MRKDGYGNENIGTEKSKKLKYCTEKKNIEELLPEDLVNFCKILQIFCKIVLNFHETSAHLLDFGEHFKKV